MTTSVEIIFKLHILNSKLHLEHREIYGVGEMQQGHFSGVHGLEGAQNIRLHLVLKIAISKEQCGNSVNHYYYIDKDLS